MNGNGKKKKKEIRKIATSRNPEIISRAVANSPDGYYEESKEMALKTQARTFNGIRFDNLLLPTMDVLLSGWK